MIPPEMISQTFGVAGVVVYLVYEIRRGVVADLQNEVGDLREELNATRTVARRNRTALRRLTADQKVELERRPRDSLVLRDIDRDEG